jgi:hypothetical protein
MTCIILVRKEKRAEIAHSVSTKPASASRWQVAMKSSAAQMIRPIDNLREWSLIKSTEFRRTKTIPRDSGRKNFVVQIAHLNVGSQRNNVHFSSVQLGTLNG